jgi:hypothetical protein
MTARDFQRIHAQAMLYIGRLLGPRPRGEAAKDAAIRHATEALLRSNEPEAESGRYIAAVEYTAWVELAPRHRSAKPTATDWTEAIAIVRGSTPEDFENRVRGGVSIEARWLWEKGGVRRFVNMVTE